MLREQQARKRSACCVCFHHCMHAIWTTRTGRDAGKHALVQPSACTCWRTPHRTKKSAFKLESIAMKRCVVALSHHPLHLPGVGSFRRHQVCLVKGLGLQRDACGLWAVLCTSGFWSCLTFGYTSAKAFLRTWKQQDRDQRQVASSPPGTWLCGVYGLCMRTTMAE